MPVIQAKPKGKSQESTNDANSDISNGSRGNVGLAKDDPCIYEMPRGLMTKKQMREIMYRYGVPPKFVCRLPGDGECISYPSPIEVAIYEETFQAGFHHPFYLFIEWFLARYRLVLP